MKESKPQLPKFKSLDELVNFFDTHDMGDYWEQLPEAHFEVKLEHRKHLFALDEDLADRLTEFAISRHTSVEELINNWVREKIAKH